MSYILIIVYIANNAVALDSLTFSDKASCIKAGEAITSYIDDVDYNMGEQARFNCLPVSGLRP